MYCHGECSGNKSIAECSTFKENRIFNTGNGWVRCQSCIVKTGFLKKIESELRERLMFQFRCVLPETLDITTFNYQLDVFCIPECLYAVYDDSFATAANTCNKFGKLKHHVDRVFWRHKNCIECPEVKDENKS
jgi:hypothetical protein